MTVLTCCVETTEPILNWFVPNIYFGSLYLHDKHKFFLNRTPYIDKNTTKTISCNTNKKLISVILILFVLKLGLIVVVFKLFPKTRLYFSCITFIVRRFVPASGTIYLV